MGGKCEKNGSERERKEQGKRGREKRNGTIGN